MIKLFQSSFIAATFVATLFAQKPMQGKEFPKNGNNLNSSTLVCRRSGDRNRGHGNDPYVEFEMNIENIGKANISGDFDLDNPGKSLDKQMEIIAEGEKIQWPSLNDEQKQEIKDEWARQICPSSSSFSD